MRYPAPLSFGNWLMCRADSDYYYDLAGAYVECLISGCYNGVPDGRGREGQLACIDESIIGKGAEPGVPRLYADRWGPIDLRDHMRGLDPGGEIQDACWAAFLDADTFFESFVIEEWRHWCEFLRSRGVLAPIFGEVVDAESGALL